MKLVCAIMLLHMRLQPLGQRGLPLKLPPPLLYHLPCLLSHNRSCLVDTNNISSNNSHGIHLHKLLKNTFDLESDNRPCLRLRLRRFRGSLLRLDRIIGPHINEDEEE
jgi:hypothetical protein